MDGLLVQEHQGERRELTVLRLEKLAKEFPRAGRVVDSIDLQIREWRVLYVARAFGLRQVDHSSNDRRVRRTDRRPHILR